jgi:hypothetical protein
MQWLAIIALIGVVLVLINLYRVCLGEIAALTNYALLILLDEKVREEQRRGSSEFVHLSDAKSANELGGNVVLEMQSIAGDLDHTMLDVNELLWKLKNERM